MTRLEFDALVRRIEGKYADRPAALGRAAKLWVNLGLAGIVSWILLFILAGGAALAAGAMLEPPAGVVLMVVGVLSILYGLSQAAYILAVDVAAPEGHLLTPAEAPALQALLESVRTELQSRPFDEVRITMDFNARVYQIPRLGLVGWPRTVLEIGLPLARALGPEEFRAVLAHEFAHVSERHTSSGGRLYLLRVTWHDLLERMQRPVSGSIERASRWCLAKFLDWYWPRLNARLIVLSRAHEFDADRQAVRVAGSAAVAGALWRLECFTPWLFDRFWPELFQRAAEAPEPPADILQIITDAYLQRPSGDVEVWVTRALTRATAGDDTHPAFPDRARAFGRTVEDFRRIGFPAPAQPSSAEVFLASDLSGIERELSDEWRRSVLATWRDRHRQAKAEVKRRQASAGQQALGSDPSTAVNVLWESAKAVLGSQGVAGAAPLLWKVLDAEPTHAGASVVLGAHLARAGEPKGEQLLRDVVERGDEIWLPRACEALEQHYQAIGRMDLVHETRAGLDRHEAKASAARLERSNISARDRFIADGLGDEALLALQKVLAGVAGVSKAWLARKDLKHFPQRQLFVLCVASASSGWWWRRAEAEDALVRQVTPKLGLPGQHLVIARCGSFSRLARKIVSLPGALVYPPEAAPGVSDPLLAQRQG